MARTDQMADELQFGEDYYFNEDGFMVFTSAFLLKRGFCCRSGCRHCPYGFRDNSGSDTPRKESEPEGRSKG